MQENNEIFITLKGRVPSKKNSRVIFSRNGRIVNIPSKPYTEWHKDAMEQLSGYDEDTLKYVELIELDFYAPDRRGTDLTNKAESIMDLLVDKGVIEDDNWWIVAGVLLSFKGVDKANPRCEVTIRRKITNAK